MASASSRQRNDRLGRSHRNGQHDPPRAVGASDLARGPSRGAGGDAVVDDHGGAAGEVHPRRNVA